jgi:hypothetical protein
MEDAVPFGSRDYFMHVLMLLVARGADFLSTWIATPSLRLEGNPIARRLGWRMGTLVNLVICGVFGLWPLAALIIATTSVLVASRNFQIAWLTRSYGEANYQDWLSDRVAETSPGLYVFCLLAQTALLTLVGLGLVWASGWRERVPLGIGLGMVGYAVAVLGFTCLALWRQRRASRLQAGVFRLRHEPNALERAPTGQP